MKPLRCPSCKKTINQPVCQYCNEPVLKNLIELTNVYASKYAEYKKALKIYLGTFFGLMILVMFAAKYVNDTLFWILFFSVTIGNSLIVLKKVGPLSEEVQELQVQFTDYDPNFLKKILFSLAGMMLLHNLLDYLEVGIRDLNVYGVDVNTNGTVSNNVSDVSVGNIGNQLDVNSMLSSAPQQMDGSYTAGIQVDNMVEIDQYTISVISNPLNNQDVQIDINNNYVDHHANNMTHHIINNDGTHMGDLHETAQSTTVTNNLGNTIINIEKGNNVDVMKDQYGYATGYINHSAYCDTITNHFGETEILINKNGSIYNKIGEQIGSFRIYENGLKIYDRFGKLDKTVKM